MTSELPAVVKRLEAEMAAGIPHRADSLVWDAYEALKRQVEQPAE